MIDPDSDDVDPRRISTRADLRRAIQTLHAARDLSYHDVAAAAELGSPGTVHNWISGKAFPRWVILKKVLEVWGVTDRAEIAQWKKAHTKAYRHDASGVGVPIGSVTDPFSYEVHRPISISGEPDLPLLPNYIRRTHDEELDTIVDRAVAGTSAMVVLLAGSSTGKTRALWEALTPLRQAGWRIWHPWNPTRLQALREGLPEIGARTVLWLNDTHRYFEEGTATDREQTATGLRTLLADTARAPVLILGTLWPTHYDSLTSDPSSPTRVLLQASTVIDVPTAFADEELELARSNTEGDPRLRMAIERAEHGQITQYLAGGPELVDRYRRQLSPAARAVVEVAMDAVRLGHRNSLPYMLLHDTAAYYMSDDEWDALDEETWFEQALAETSRRCKGARGPVTPLRSRPLDTDTSSRRQPSRRRPTTQGIPVFQLADYLDQYGRIERAGRLPRRQFWEVVALHSDPVDLHILGRSAQARGLYRTAAQLWKNAVMRGHAASAAELIRMLHRIRPTDTRPTRWAVSKVAVDDPMAVLYLLDTMQMTGAVGLGDSLVARLDPDQFSLDNPIVVWGAIQNLRALGRHDLASAIIARIDLDQASLSPPLGLVVLRKGLKEAGNSDLAAAVLARIDPARVPLDDLFGVSLLISVLNDEEMREHLTALVDRIDPEQVPFNNLLAHLLRELHEVDMADRAAKLADQATIRAAREGVPAVIKLLGLLHDAGMEDRATLIADTVVPGVDPEDLPVVVLLLATLKDAGMRDHASALAARLDPDRIPLDDLLSAGLLCGILWEVGEHARVTALLARIDPGEIHLDDVMAAAQWMTTLHMCGDMRTLARVASQLDPDQLDLRTSTPTSKSVAVLLYMVSEAGKRDIALALAERAATQMPLDDTEKVRALMDTLLALRMRGPISTLVERLPAAGQFGLFEEFHRARKQFVFGYERHGIAASPWRWDDLV
ncbi:hypothetical protein [Nocardia brasiliensis]|uniref:hypothetical protein n=1 Tax=Nocardia brasiliensis TaxID=37326 RepID=UPI003D944281